MGHGFIAPNPSSESQSKSGLLRFLGIISSRLHELQLVLRRWPWTPYSLIHLYSILTLTVAYHHILRSWRVLKESFLSGICPGLLVGSSDFFSRSDRKLTLSQTPQKLQSVLHTPITNPNIHKIISPLFLSLAPLWLFSPVLMQTANSSKLSDNNSTGKSSESNKSTQRSMKYNLWGNGKGIFVFLNIEKRRLNRDMITVLKNVNDCNKEEGNNLFSPTWKG